MYVKLFSDIIQSSIWAEDSDTCKVWITMLALANQDGLVRATAPAISHEARVPMEKTEKVLHHLESPDPHSRTPDNEGRRIERTDCGYLILNYPKYREMKDDDRRRAMDRDRQRRFRDCHASSRDVTLQSRQAEAEAEAGKKNTPAPSALAQDFETFWKAYPRKKSKGRAEKAWRKVAPDPALLSRILAALEKAKASPDWRKDGGQFIPYPEKWLNARGWEDEWSAPPEGSELASALASDSNPDRLKADLQTLEEEIEQSSPPPKDIEGRKARLQLALGQLGQYPGGDPPEIRAKIAELCGALQLEAPQ